MPHEDHLREGIPSKDEVLNPAASTMRPRVSSVDGPEEMAHMPTPPKLQPPSKDYVQRVVRTSDSQKPTAEPTPESKKTRCTWPAAAVGSAQTLLHGAVMFTTSKLFDILFTAFIAKLHAQPFCHDFLQDLYSQSGNGTANLPTCPEEAGSAALFWYATVWVVPVATAVKCFADWTNLLKFKLFEDLPTVLNMLVGWAFGAAFTKHLNELEASYAAELCHDDDMCNVFRLCYCTAVSLGCGFVISVVGPLAKEVEFGSGKLIDMLEDLLEDFFAMVHRGASVTVMTIWYYAIKETGPRAQNITCSDTDIRLHFFWACTTTLMGSQLSRFLEEREDRARENAKKAGKPLTTLTSCLILASDLIQTILGFTAANSWLMFIRLVPPFKSYMTDAPTVSGMLENFGVGVLLFVLGLWYVYVTGESKPAGKFSQMAFTLNSMSFTLGNVWVTMSVKAYPQLALLLGTLPGFTVMVVVVYVVLDVMDTYFVLIFGCCTQPGEVVPAKNADTERRKMTKVAMAFKRATAQTSTKLRAVKLLSSPSPGRVRALSDVFGGQKKFGGDAAATGAGGTAAAARRYSPLLPERRQD